MLAACGYLIWNDKVMPGHISCTSLSPSRCLGFRSACARASEAFLLPSFSAGAFSAGERGVVGESAECAVQGLKNNQQQVRTSMHQWKVYL